MITQDTFSVAEDDAGCPETSGGVRGSTASGAPVTRAATAQRRIQPHPGSDIGRSLASPSMIVFISVNAALVALAVFAIVRFGSVRIAIGYYLKGESLLVDATEKSIGAPAPGETVVVSFMFTNCGDEPVRLLGCRTLCNCAVPLDLPYTLGPNESRGFSLRLKTPSRGYPPRDPDSAHFYLPLTVFTSNRAQSHVGLAVRGEVRQRPAAVN